MPKKKYSASIKDESPGLFYLLPIAFIISVVPLIVYMKVVELTPIEIKNWYGEQYYTDFFSYYKSQWLMAGTIFAAVFYFVQSLVHKFRLKKSFIYFPALIYAGLAILSTVLSEHRTVALRGFVARFEGMYALLCYVALFLLAFNMVNSEKHIKFILGALLASATVIGLTGLFQFLGYDLFRTDFGKRLILPKAYHDIADSLQFRFELSNIFSTFSNPNYIGSYMVLVIPIAFSMFLYTKKWYLKISLGLLTLVLLVNLFGSRSLAGIAGFIFSVCAFCLFFFVRRIVQRKNIFLTIMISVIVVAAAAGGFIGVNRILEGELVKDIKTQYTEFLGEGNRVFDLKDIVFDDNKITIVTGTESLTIENRDNHLLFYGTDGNALEYSKSENEDKTVTRVRFKDEKYKNFRIDVQGNIITFTHPSPYATFQIKVYENAGFKLIGVNGHETDSIERYEHFGFEGREKLGSSRGYIWSRTLPLLKRAVVYGFGPDTYAIAFPQHDYIGKIRAFNTTQMIVDKPHNTYLQIGVNTGVLSLAALLLLWGFFVVQGLIVYLKNRNNDIFLMSGAGILTGVLGYLATSLANDSVVAIAPVFWTLLGTGFAVNTIFKKKTIGRTT